MTADQHLYFKHAPISNEIYSRIYNLSYKKNCNLPLDALSYLSLLHYGFDGQVHAGEMIVNRRIADKVLLLFQELLAARYPIEKIHLIDDYNADDYVSMSDNNSSAFNYRVIDGTDILSNHSLGLAIDINPLYNPYIKSVGGNLRILPPEGSPYIDRFVHHPYMIQSDDICYQTFLKHGFTWGGDWDHCKDYQHFEIQ